MPEQAGVWRLRLPAVLESVERFQGLAMEAASACGFPPDVLFRVELALEEMLVNVVHYAYGQADDGWIELSCDVNEAGELTVEICDGGRSFDPLSLPDPKTDAPVSEREVGGLGVYLVRKMADGVSYRRSDDRNILTLTFRRPAEAAGDP